MNNLWTLIKIEFSKSFSRNKIKENKAKSMSFLAIISLVIIFGIVLSSVYAYLYGKYYIDAGATLEPLVILFAVVASMLSLMSGINQAKGIFIGKDYDQLASLPIKKTTIIASKVINLYLVELLYSSIILIPSSIVFTILSGNSLFVINGIILALFISSFPLVIAMIFSFITALISEKFKYGNFVSIIFYVIFIGGIFALSFFTSSSKTDADIVNVFTSVSNVALWFNPSLYFVNYALINNYAFILIFVGINFISMVIVILVFGLFFDKIHEVISSFKANYKYERKYLKSKKELKSLFELELKRLVSSKMYFINSVTGLIMSLIMGIWMSIMFSSYSPFGISPEVIEAVKNYAFAGAIIIVFGVGITNTCAVGISMEGSSFWLIKTLPINYKKYMWAKLLLTIILQVPVSLIVSTVMTIVIMPNVISIIAIYLIPILYICLTAVVSLLLNLTFYKLKWSNEQEVVKSSSSVIIAMLLGFGIDFVLVGLLVGLGIFLNVYIGVFIAIGLLFIALIIFYLILSSTFTKKIMKIEEF